MVTWVSYIRYLPDTVPYFHEICWVLWIRFLIRNRIHQLFVVDTGTSKYGRFFLRLFTGTPKHGRFFNVFYTDTPKHGRFFNVFLKVHFFDRVVDKNLSPLGAGYAGLAGGRSGAGGGGGRGGQPSHGAQGRQQVPPRQEDRQRIIRRYLPRHQHLHRGGRWEPPFQDKKVTRVTPYNFF